MSVVDVIRHYQRSIEKCPEDETRMLHCINKLCHLPITVQHLKETGVGRTVNALRKYEGQVGEIAKYTVSKWKQMVADEESSEEDGEEPGTEVLAEETNEVYARDEEEEVEEEEEEEVEADSDSDSDSDKRTPKENSRHALRENHAKKKKDDNHKKDAHRHEQKVQKEKLQKHAEQQNSRKHKSEDPNNAGDRHSHKRKRESSKNHRREEKRKKYESDSENLSDDDSGSQEMQIDEQVNEEGNMANSTEEEVEEREDEDDDDEEEEEEEEDNEGGGNVTEQHHRKLSQSHRSHSKHRSSGASSSHHRKHHKESHRKHEKHKEKKPYSSDKYSKKSDSDKVNERTSGSDHKEKQSKHKDSKTEHKNHKLSGSSSKADFRKEKSDNVKQKTDSVLKDSNSSKLDSKKRTKEKTGIVEKLSSSERHHSSSEAKSKDRREKKVKRAEINEDDDGGGISSLSGASFAEALGMVDPLKKKKAPITSGSSSNSKAVRTSNSKTLVEGERSSSKSKEMKPPKVPPSAKAEPAPLLTSSVKLEPLEVDLDATLPEISPNYRPLPHPNVDVMPHRKVKTISDEEALAIAMSQKNQRTRVYSGLKSGKSWSSVPSLFDICVRILQENIEAIEYTGGVPYDLLKPVLNIATPDQLFMLEHYNPYLIEDTDDLWAFHCKKSFRNKPREDMESWRDMYVRCVEEREAKLKALTSNIQQSIAKSTPVRQTKLAYVDSVVKPPRNVAKQQAKYGTAGPTVISKGSPVKGSKPGVGGQNAVPSTSAAAVPVPPPRGLPPALKIKPRMAPLMQKTMKLVKSFKR